MQSTFLIPALKIVQGVLTPLSDQALNGVLHREGVLRQVRQAHACSGYKLPRVLLSGRVERGGFSSRAAAGGSPWQIA